MVLISDNEGSIFLNLRNKEECFLHKNQQMFY